MRDHVLILARRVKEEKDPDKLVELAKEIVRLVDEKRARIKREHEN
jgi:hypothetical protein